VNIDSSAYENIASVVRINFNQIFGCMKNKGKYMGARSKRHDRKNLQNKTYNEISLEV